MRIHPLPLSLALGLATALTPVLAHAQNTGQDGDAQPAPFTHPDGSPFTTDEKIEQLQQELDTLKSQRSLDQEVAAGTAAKAATVTLDKKGLNFASPDDKYAFGLNVNGNVDLHSFGNDGGTLQDEVVDRLIRPTLSGKAGNAFFKVTAELGGSSSAAASLVDGYIGYTFSRAVQVQAGKFKSPIGLERLQSDPDVIWVERGLSTNLTPNRDIGYQVSGSLIPNVLDYQVALLDGAADGQNLNNDLDNHKDLAYRVFATPFSQSGIVWLQGFGIGWAGSDGQHLGNTTNTQLPSYKSVGQQTFFKYATGVYANGKETRSNPQAYFYLNNFGLLVDYIEAKQEVARGAASARLTNTALDVSGSWVLTGESVGYKGGVKPAHDFSLKNGGWGAWELTARYGYNDIDKDAFTGGFASIGSSARKATDTGLGLGWYWSENLKLLLDYDQTKFEGGAAGGADRRTEDFTAARVQFRY